MDVQSTKVAQGQAENRYGGGRGQSEWKDEYKCRWGKGQGGVGIDGRRKAKRKGKREGRKYLQRTCDKASNE